MTDAGSGTGGSRERGARRAPVHPAVDRLGAYSWRLIGMGVVAVALVWLLAQLWVIVLALAIAVLLSRALDPVASRLHRRGWRPALVALAVMLGFAALLAGIAAALTPSILAEFEDLGPTIENAVDDIEDWIVEDSPFDISRSDIRDFRDQADERIDQLMSESETSVVDTTLVVFEAFTAVILALITTFFMLKDGGRFARWSASLLPERQRPLVTRLATRAWWTLGGYLRGAATLGIIEGVIIGLTVWLVGGELALPVAVITFFAAFIPFVGAIVAGAIAVAVTLVTSGAAGALVVLAVAVVVQQLDNDLLAPVVYGRSLELHPLVVLFSLTGGSALMGPVGALFAVPLAAVAINVLAEARKDWMERNGPAAGDAEPEPEPEPEVEGTAAPPGVEEASRLDP